MLAPLARAFPAWCSRLRPRSTPFPERPRVPTISSPATGARFESDAALGADRGQRRRRRVRPRSAWRSREFPSSIGSWTEGAPSSWSGRSWPRVRSRVRPDGRRFQAWRSRRRPSLRMSATRISPPRYERRTTAVASHWPREGLSTVHSSGSARRLSRPRCSDRRLEAGERDGGGGTGGGLGRDLANERAVRCPDEPAPLEEAGDIEVALDPEPLDRRTRDDGLDERAADALQPMVREHEEIRQRELSIGDALDADATDELAILAPADEGPRRLASARPASACASRRGPAPRRRRRGHGDRRVPSRSFYQPGNQPSRYGVATSSA